MAPNDTTRDQVCASLDTVIQPAAAYSSWVAALRTGLWPWDQVKGHTATWRLDHSAMRTTTGFLSAAATAPALTVAFDEGSKVAVITRAALKKCLKS